MFTAGAGLARASNTDAAASAAGPSRESEKSEAPNTTALMVQEEAESCTGSGTRVGHRCGSSWTPGGRGLGFCNCHSHGVTCKKKL